MKARVMAVLAAAGLASAALAQYDTGLQGGPFDSNGTAGSAVNGVYAFTYTGADPVYNRVQIQGTATSGGIGSFLSELRWRLVLDGGATRDSGGLISGTTWTGGQAVDNTQPAAGFSLIPGNSYQFRFWESFNDGGDAGIDAQWSNVHFMLSFLDPRPNATNLGFFPSGPFDANTFDSNFDTEMGLYDDNGNLITNNDDSGGGLQSAISVPGGLADGRYYIAVGGFNSSFGASQWGVTGGGASGHHMLSIDGNPVAEGDTTAGQIAWYSFNVPTPGAMALLGLGGLVAGRRRR